MSGALELLVPAGQAARVLRLAGSLRPKLGRQGGGAVALAWYEAAPACLAPSGLALVQGTECWLERLWPEAGAPAPVVRRAGSVAELAPEGRVLSAVAVFEGRDRVLNLGGPGGAIRLCLRQGVMRAGAAERAECRLILTGDAAAVGGLAEALAARAGVWVGVGGAAVAALRLAGVAVGDGRPEAAVLDGEMSVEAGFLAVVGGLSAALLYWAERVLAVPEGEFGPQMEPVHQLRVTLRRLRSAWSVWGGVIAGAEAEAIKVGLRGLGRVLGPARDWDVFLDETAAGLLHAAGPDGDLAGLVGEAERARAARYGALRAALAGPGFARLGVGLVAQGLARGWRGVASEAGLAELDGGLAGFAAEVLGRRRKRLRLPKGASIATMPAVALHELRLEAKRLRYGCEFFGPVFGGKRVRRFQKRLARLQERLGVLNDGAVARGLVGGLAGGRGRAGGLVEGYVAAGERGARGRIAAAWARMEEAEGFWG